MKHGKNGLILAFSLMLLTGCGERADDVQSVEAEQEKTQAAFAAALQRLEQEGVYPDGSTGAERGLSEYQDQYAILDVDGDGKEELLLQHENDCMAGKFTAIYGFDPETESLREELREWPEMQIYENGYLVAESSHNQTCGNLWPYALYRYDQQTDAYVQTHRVHSRDQALISGKEEDEEVYFVNAAAEDDWNEETPIPQAEYLAWEKTWKDGAEEIQPDWKEISVPGVDSDQAVG